MKILSRSSKILEDPQGSWQENEGSLRIFTKVSEDLNKDPHEDPHADLYGSLKILERFSPGSANAWYEINGMIANPSKHQGMILQCGKN